MNVTWFERYGARVWRGDLWHKTEGRGTCRQGPDTRKTFARLLGWCQRIWQGWLDDLQHSSLLPLLTYLACESFQISEIILVTMSPVSSTHFSTSVRYWILPLATTGILTAFLTAAILFQSSQFLLSLISIVFWLESYLLVQWEVPSVPLSCHELLSFELQQPPTSWRTVIGQH